MNIRSRFNQPQNRKSAGFTLVELMIVVAVIGILSAIGYPSYVNYVKRAHRSAAAQLMLKIASREEQYMLDARAYTTVLYAASPTASVGLGATEDDFTCTATQCANQYYTITVAAPGGTPPTYMITAAPSAKQAGTSFQNLTLDNTGAKTPIEEWQK
jgi:type IV pilus assembly protein PilE